MIETKMALEVDIKQELPEIKHELNINN